MPFTYPGTSIYSPDGDTRVVWSAEEYDDALAEGWSEEAPAPDGEPLDPAPKKRRGKGGA